MKLGKGTEFNLDTIFDQNIQEQAKIVKLISNLLRKRQKLLEDLDDLSPVSGP